ncbi:MAG: site-specific DNA-methyltransferase [Polyangiaceae bacterium]|nr:site-specific DNA-methyltransferase [Polyangiaceae bacterium]
MIEHRRRALTNVGGDADEGGDRTASKALAHAIDVDPTEDANAPDRAHVHGFHAYPARLHPVTARRLIEFFSSVGDTVVDPFCGSGTVPVEAMLAGRNAIGTDLNPLAVMLARSKTYPRTPEQISRLVDASKGVAAFADARRKAKAGALRRLPREDALLFAPHVLLELGSLRAGIDQAPAETRPDLKLVLSSILVKLSQTRGDTADDAVDKRISRGYPARLFVKKTEELARRFGEFAALVPSPKPRVRILVDDARTLHELDDASVDAIITSPPYVATYNYLAHHDMRMRWLGLDARRFAEGEVGARRNYERLSPSDARRHWAEELADLLRAIARVARRGAPVILLIGDSVAARGPHGEPPEALYANDVVADVANHLQSLVPVARASQTRPHFHGPTASAFRDRPRAEHALLLRRA